MGRRDRTVSNELSVKTYTINDILVYYLENRFYVNRRYQRKLVWDLNDKCLLIDSILKGIPLPAVLIAQYVMQDGTSVLEIVDGLQRLDAIVSFMLGKFSVPYNGEQCYFDPNANPDTFNLMQDGKICRHDKVLPRDMCIAFYRYQLSAVTTGQDDETIELIFSRINSAGKKISTQDLRQSYSTGEFPDLVRRVASRVRGDYTYDDRICLCDIGKISIGSKDQGYGVDIRTIFWRRHDLVSPTNIRESKDEEIIEALIATILLGDKFKKSKKILDDLYDADSELGKEITAKVSEVGKDIIENEVSRVFDQIDMVFNAVDSTFSKLLFDKNTVSNKDECFKVVFRAFYELLTEGYTITDYVSVARALKQARSLFDAITQSGLVKYDIVDNIVRNMYKLLLPAFSRSIANVDNEFTLELDKRLSYSKIERQLTEFKIGVSNFGENCVNQNVIHTISKTLVAMANISSAKEDGLVIVGVADSKEAYDGWSEVFDGQPVIVNSHFVPGISCEAKKLYRNTDTYYRRLRKFFENEPISAKLKNYVLETFEVIDYHGVELLILRSRYMGEISLYKGEKYIRYSNETIKCPAGH